MNEELKKDLEKLLSSILTDTEMALDDTWDRSDDGFVAIQDLIYELAKKHDLKVEIFNYPE